MTDLSVDQRLSAWVELRKRIDEVDSPFEAVVDFWKDLPFVAYNKNIDPYNQRSWPTPWDIISENIYDDFTIALMTGYTLLLTKKFADSRVEIKTMVDKNKTKLYNLVYLDDNTVLNYEQGPVKAQDIPDSFRLENLVILHRPR
jgi:hypothetical protein